MTSVVQTGWPSRTPMTRMTRALTTRPATTLTWPDRAAAMGAEKTGCVTARMPASEAPAAAAGLASSGTTLTALGVGFVDRQPATASTSSGTDAASHLILRSHYLLRASCA